MSQFQIGDILAGKYEINAIIGAGGMGTVYRAKQIDLGRDVAIKVPNPQALQIPGFLQRFGREAKLCARLVHDNIVQVYEYQESEDAVYIVMEYVEGKDLKGLTKQPPSGLKVKDMAEILRASLEGLGCAHEFGIVHRDIKPHNIMVQQRSHGKWRVKIMDFGIAHMDQNANLTMNEEQLTVTGQAIGTPTYMSPEQIRGTGVVPASDIYSFGCVMFYVFTRKTPFQGTGFTVAASHLSDPAPMLTQHIPDLPKNIADVVNRCLEKDPNDRPQSAMELGQEVYEALEDIFDLEMADIWPEAESSDARTKIPAPKGQKGPADATVSESGSEDAATALIDRTPSKAASASRGPKPTHSTERETLTSSDLKKQDIVPPDPPSNATSTSPEGLDQTIPYVGMSKEAIAVPSVVDEGGEEGQATSKGYKPVVILAVILIPAFLIVGVVAGIAFLGGDDSESGSEVEQVISQNNSGNSGTSTDDPSDNIDTEGSTGGESQVQIDPVVTPTPEPLETQVPATPTVSPTPSPSPSPTVDPVIQLITSTQGFYDNAESLQEKGNLWRDIVTDRRFVEEERLQDFANDLAVQTTKNPVMVPIDSGRFTMGSSNTSYPDETPENNVRLDSYAIGSYEVTAFEFSTFLNAIGLEAANEQYTPSDKTTVIYSDELGLWIPRDGFQTHPANAVSWYAATEYCKWLSSVTGERFRLPTEAEWENAARGNRTEQYPWGTADPDQTTAQFNTAGPTDIFQKRAGKQVYYDIYHLAGNVAEWCYDWYDDAAYQQANRDNPTGPSTAPDGSRSRKVLRGGSFLRDRSDDLVVTRRDRMRPDRREIDVGFRLARDGS